MCSTYSRYRRYIQVREASMIVSINRYSCFLVLRFSPSVRPFVRSSVRSSVRSFVRPSVCPFVRSFVRSFVRLFVGVALVLD